MLLIPQPRSGPVLVASNSRTHYPRGVTGSTSAANVFSHPNVFSHLSRRARCSCSMETTSRPIPRLGARFRTMARARTSPSGTLKSSCRLVPTGGGCCVQINRPPSPKFSRLETYFSFPFFQTTRVVLCALRLGYRRISRSTVICQLLLLLIFLESSLDCTEPKPSVHVSLMSKVCGYPNRALVGILFS